MIIQSDKRSLTGDVDDTARALSADHPDRHMLGNEHRPPRIHRHDPIEASRGGIDSPLEQSDPGTIHQPIEHPKRFERFIDSGLIAHIEHQRFTTRLFSQPRQLIHIPRSGHNMRTGSTQSLDDSPPNPTRRARNENRPTRKIKSSIHDVCNRCMTGFNAGYKSV